MIPAMISAKNEQTIIMGGGLPPQGYVVQPAIIPPGNYATPSDPFPYKAHRVTGFLQIFLGLAAIGLQVGDMLISRVIKQELLEDVQNRTEPENAVDVDIDGAIYSLTQAEKMLYFSFGAANAATGMWTGFLFILTGAFGASMTPDRYMFKKSLKNAYLVLSILMAVFIAPALFIAASIEVAQLNGHGWGIRREACPWLLLAVGLSEFLLAIVAAAICCCCSDADYTPGPIMGSQAIVAYPSSPPPQPQPPVVDPSQTRIPPFNPDHHDHGDYITQPTRIRQDDGRYAPDPTEPRNMTHPHLKHKTSTEAGYLHFNPGSPTQPPRGDSDIYHEIPASHVEEGEYLHPGRPAHQGREEGYMNMSNNKQKGPSDRGDQAGYMYMGEKGKAEYVSHSRPKKGPF